MNEAFHISRARVETLVDGIFAIAMTILVLEVKVPELADKRSVDELLLALGHHGYVIAAYFFSFAMLAVFWTWHHRMTEKVHVFDKALLACIVGFLSLICFFPFAAALFGRYPTNGGALFVYVMITGCIVAIQTLYFKIAMMRGLLLESVSRARALQGHARNLRGCGVFMIASIPASLRLHEWVAIFAALLGGIFVWHAKRTAATAASLSEGLA